MKFTCICPVCQSKCIFSENKCFDLSRSNPFTHPSSPVIFLQGLLDAPALFYLEVLVFQIDLRHYLPIVAIEASPFSLRAAALNSSE